MKFPKGMLDLSTPRVMGILNVTPDSFSDGGQHQSLHKAIEQGLRMVDQGAMMIDIGGESTRPGAPDVALQEELDRVIPVIEALRERTEALISVDTSKAAVMSAAIKAGADLINDVRALQEQGALEVVAKSTLPVCLMHMQGQPRTMQKSPVYSEVVTDVRDFLAQRISACEAAGIGKERILIDPGFGFGKTLQHNYALLARLGELRDLNLPMLIGLSRKTMLGDVTGRAVDERVAASVAGATIATLHGAAILRVHDVAETVDAVAVAHATLIAKQQ